MKNRTDAELVELAMLGDRDAFGELVRRYQGAAYAVARGVTGHHEDAEDAVQDAFATALRRLEECRDPKKFAGWLLAIARNTARNVVRRESLRVAEPVPQDVRSSLPGPDAEAELAELRRDLEAALAELPAMQREIVLLYDLEGWKHDEIAERLGVPSGTVRSHLHFARKALRERLSKWQGRETQARDGNDAE